MSSGRALSPRSFAPMHQRILLAVRDPDLGAPVAAMVAVSPSQSAWSEITSGSSTPRWRARARTRIQPDANAVTGSGKRRDHSSLQRRRRAERDGAGELRLLGAAHGAQLAELDAAAARSSA